MSFKDKLPKVNNHPMGEFSPNLVTLMIWLHPAKVTLQQLQCDQIGRNFAG
jgi:hypothetical protein